MKGTPGRLSLAVFLLLLSNAAAFAQAKTAPKITAIKAQLFYEHNATFSRDILSAKDFTLWNTIIGEGSAGFPSTSTFVTVEISGRNVPVGSLKVEITAQGNENRILQKKIIGVEIYDDRTRFYAPLWLSDTGCEEIKISARLVGKSASPTVMRKTIPFACGE